MQEMRHRVVSALKGSTRKKEFADIGPAALVWLPVESNIIEYILPQELRSSYHPHGTMRKNSKSLHLPLHGRRLCIFTRGEGPNALPEYQFWKVGLETGLYIRHDRRPISTADDHLPAGSPLALELVDTIHYFTWRCSAAS